MASNSVLDAYDEAIGRSPTQIAASGRPLKAPELAAILEARSRIGSLRVQPTRANSQLWPLVSHHTYGNRAIFGTGSSDVLPRTLTLLLLHDGLVISDPLETVRTILVTRSEGAAVAALNQATIELAQVEPLIAAGALRLTSVRPNLQDANRRATLAAFGLSPDLRVFTDLLEAAGSIPAFPGSLTRTFAPQVQELYRVFGIAIPQPKDRSSAERRIKDLAAGVIEVSWQFAVAAEDPASDLAFIGPLEQHLARALLAEGFNGSVGAGRHLATLDLGHVPNLDSNRLTLADAIAVRQDDTFESFRHTVRLALDHMESARRSGVEQAIAKAIFEEAMSEGSRRLRAGVGQATFKDRVKDAALPASLGVVAELAVAPAGPVPAAAAAAGISISTVLWQWLLGRRHQNRQTPCLRYLSMLGGTREQE